jgi:uncharacterized protein YprB with RNaseH-like and TPR domain
MKILFIDIETSPNTAHVWGLFDQRVGLNQLMESSYILCWAAKWNKVPGVHFSGIYEDKPASVVKAAWDLLDEADVVIHYNGKKFDVPTLNKEFLLLGFPPPSPFKQIDLYHVVRRKFKFPSRKLDYVAQQLGIGKKHKHEGHELWVKCMAGDEKAWRRMKIYNKQDVVLLERLYKHLLPWIEQHPNHGLYVDSERPVCTNCGSKHVQKRGVEHTKTQTYQRFQCMKCHTWMKGRFKIGDRTEHVLTQVV